MGKLKKFRKGYKTGLNNSGQNKSIIINTLLLTIVYSLGVGITSIAAKIAKKQFIVTEISDVDSYWEDTEPQNLAIEDYYRLF